LELSTVGRLVNESRWGFPGIVGMHILGLALSAGTIVWFDLRLLGMALRDVPVSKVYRRLIPWAGTGFALMGITGGLLFVGYASSAFDNVYFRLKMGGIALAGLNALVFHVATTRRVEAWDGALRPPAAARLAGLFSIALWAAVIMSGRLMSYTMF